jgi:AcrR family transcriptional regulator
VIREKEMPKIIENIRERIVEKAFGLFIMEGYDGVNTARIAEECHIGAGTLFNYFPTKWELLLEVLEEVRKRGTENFIEMMLEVDEEEERVHRMVSGMYFFIDRLGKLDREFFLYLLSQSEESLEKLKCHDQEEEAVMINAMRESFSSLQEIRDEEMCLIMKMIRSIVIASFTRDTDKQDESKRFASRVIISIINNIEEISRNKQEDRC